jgi:hypothetical protein
VFINLVVGPFLEAMASKDTSPRDMGASPAAIAMERPKFFFKRVPSLAIERPKIGIASDLLGTQTRVKVSITKVPTGPRGADRGHKNFGGVSVPGRPDGRKPAGPMKPFPG